MTDGFSASMKGIGDVKKALDARQAKMERGALWALRETGRVTARAAKAVTPVYKGPGALTQKTFKADRKAAGIHAPVKGLLRASIKPSRRITSTGGSMRMTVAPRGNRVQLYRAKVEGRVPYMEVGKAAAEAAAPAIWTAAIAKSLA